MKREDIIKVRKFAVHYGDGFWHEKNNEYLVDDIIKAVNRAGYDLQLVKKSDIIKQKIEAQKPKVVAKK